MQINIKVTEVLSRTVTVEAHSIDEAIDIVETMYKKEEIVLDYADFDGNVVIEEQDENFNSKKDSLINKVIQYLIKDEEKHYEESQQPNNHIYLTLLELQEYL